MVMSEFRFAHRWLLSLIAVAAPLSIAAAAHLDDDAAPAARAAAEVAAQVHYLEIVTPDVDATCETLAELHDVSFSEPAPELGFARTAPLENGSLIGVRAPMHDGDGPVVRPYVLVEDIEAAVEAAAAAGAQIAMGATEIAGRGRFAIYFLGGIEHGLWEL